MTSICIPTKRISYEYGLYYYESQPLYPQPDQSFAICKEIKLLLTAKN